MLSDQKLISEATFPPHGLKNREGWISRGDKEAGYVPVPADWSRDRQKKLAFN